MKNLLLTAIITLICFTSCQKEEDPFLITKSNIGLLTDSTKVKDLSVVFSNDSIKKYIGGDEFTGNINDIEIYSKLTKEKIIVLTPKQALDSTSTIKTVNVLDKQFKTAKGLNSNSTFKDIKNNYKISSIQNTLRNLIVSVNEMNMYFTIEKTELPAELRFDMNLKIEAIQIPDDAKIKNFYLQWN
ncbi:hypothetical protein [Pontimicrobium sp. IMCC45349]|uniref:hypothetical protein n=1 Tax=Pontimicrobium sp. IMCC45349 TaxID=3391574 RepID=UPI0039A08106